MVGIAGRPRGPVPVPRSAVRLAGSARLEPVWRNELGGLTFRIGEQRYLKWAPAGSGLDLGAERDRLVWAGAFSPVPRPLAFEADDEGECLVTAALPGRSAVDDRWMGDDARIAVRALGEGLRALHDALPVDGCPFDWSIGERLERARRNGLSPDPSLEDAPGVDRLVVAHGDACAPNTLLDGEGRWSGHVDLGRLGLADRWADLAVATWSTGWNYGADWTELLLDAYGIEPDRDRIDYYRRLWDAT